MQTHMYAKVFLERSLAGCIHNLVVGHISLRRMWNCYGQAQRFLVTLSTEVATRLKTAAAIGRTITLKVLYSSYVCKTFQHILYFPAAFILLRQMLCAIIFIFVFR